MAGRNVQAICAEWHDLVGTLVQCETDIDAIGEQAGIPARCEEAVEEDASPQATGMLGDRVRGVKDMLEQASRMAEEARALRDKAKAHEDATSLAVAAKQQAAAIRLKEVQEAEAARRTTLHARTVADKELAEAVAERKVADAAAIKMIKEQEEATAAAEALASMEQQLLKRQHALENIQYKVTEMQRLNLDLGQTRALQQTAQYAYDRTAVLVNELAVVAAKERKEALEAASKYQLAQQRCEQEESEAADALQKAEGLHQSAVQEEQEAEDAVNHEESALAELEHQRSQAKNLADQAQSAEAEHARFEQQMYDRLYGGERRPDSGGYEQPMMSSKTKKRKSKTKPRMRHMAAFPVQLEHPSVSGLVSANVLAAVVRDGRPVQPAAATVPAVSAAPQVRHMTPHERNKAALRSVHPHAPSPTKQMCALWKQLKRDVSVTRRVVTPLPGEKSSNPIPPLVPLNQASSPPACQYFHSSYSSSPAIVSMKQERQVINTARSQVARADGRQRPVKLFGACRQEGATVDRPAAASIQISRVQQV